MKKKLFTLLLALPILFVLTACSGSATTENIDEPQTEEFVKEEEPEPEGKSEPELKTETEEEFEPEMEPETEVESEPEPEPEEIELEEEEEKVEDTSPNVACPSVNGKLQVVESQLCDEEGESVQLRGISTHGLSWYPEYVNQDCFDELKSWGANVVRLAIYTAESGGYCTDGDPEALKNLVRSGVEYATEADMYVIVDWHVLSEGTPTIYQSEAEAFFNEMSAEFSDHNNVLYEICDEPNTADWSEIKVYAEDIIPIIRANDPDAVIIVGTPTWSQDVDKAVADPITDWDNIMYTLHFYAATHKDDLRDKMTAAADSGLPIFVTEYGICDASGNGALDIDSADTWVELMNAYGISYVAWNLSNKDESSAIIASGVTQTSGFTNDDLSESGKWVYDTLSAAVDGTTPSTTANANADDSAEESQSVGSETSDGLTVDIRLDNSWDGDGGTYYLYVASVKNTSDTAIDSWSIDIFFDGRVSYSDGWNGNYSLNGSTLTIQNADYNGSLDVGESAADVGFIVIGGTNPQVR